MLEIKLQQPLNLDLTLDSGQCFRWNKIEDWWYGVVDGNVWKIKTEGLLLLVESFSSIVGKESGFPIMSGMTPENYFNLDCDYSAIIDSIRKDDSMKILTDRFEGMTILNQDPYETLLSYILSANNNVHRVKLMVESLSQNFGNKIETDVGDFFTFPTLFELQDVTEEDLRKLKFGFRAKYFKDAVDAFAEMTDTSIQSPFGDHSVSLSSLREFWQNSAVDKSLLTKIYGVGEKIADCTRLYSLEQNEVVPVDVWIRRTLTKLHKLPDKMKYQDVQNFAVDYFGDYAGWAQLFLFVSGRNGLI